MIVNLLTDGKSTQFKSKCQGLLWLFRLIPRFFLILRRYALSNDF